jgi:hydrogenase nickel incorporation protein HypA/HybF
LHELSITQSILDIVTEHANRARAGNVRGINLVVGELTGFVDESIQFYFDLLSPGTVADGARLAIRRIPAKVACRSCGQVYAPQGSRWHCPVCDVVGGDVVAGQEFLVESIEVE